MEETKLYIVLACQLWILCGITSGLDVKSEVGRTEYEEPVTLKCSLQPPNTAVQVTWTKVVGDKETPVATYTSSSGAEISKGYKHRLWMSTEGLNQNAITLYKANIEDQACYRCIFSTLSQGSKKGEMCLTIPEPLNVTVLKSQLTGCAKVTCVARSWPPAKISWLDVDGEFLTDTTYDGFLTVTSWIMIGNPKKMPRCKVLYMGEESLIDVSAGTRCQVHPLLLGLLLTKIFFL
ncbi:OX-2 membrane glycoprotein isoform 2-T2 [Leptodactylus fuscus]